MEQGIVANADETTSNGWITETGELLISHPWSLAFIVLAGWLIMRHKE